MKPNLLIIPKPKKPEPVVMVPLTLTAKQVQVFPQPDGSIDLVLVGRLAPSQVNHDHFLAMKLQPTQEAMSAYIMGRLGFSEDMVPPTMNVSVSSAALVSADKLDG